ncbi:MAG: hypothetical protein NVS3B6_16100 [Pseudarthrobacter sp.]
MVAGTLGRQDCSHGITPSVLAVAPYGVQPHNGVVSSAYPRLFPCYQRVQWGLTLTRVAAASSILVSRPLGMVTPY